LGQWRDHVGWLHLRRYVSASGLRRRRARRFGGAQRQFAGPETIDQPNPLPVLPQILSGVTEIGAAVTYSIPAGGTTVRYRAYSTIIPLKNVIWGR
jgi:hypothetical protein